MTDTAFYSGLRDQTVTPLLGQFGVASLYQTVTVPDASTYDVTSQPSAPTTSNTSVSALRVEYDKSLIDGETIQQGDFMVMLSPGELTTTPKANDYIYFNSTTADATKRYQVVSVNEVNPGGTAVLYQLQVRR